MESRTEAKLQGGALSRCFLATVDYKNRHYETRFPWNGMRLTENLGATRLACKDTTVDERKVAFPLAIPKVVCTPSISSVHPALSPGQSGSSTAHGTNLCPWHNGFRSKPYK